MARRGTGIGQGAGWGSPAKGAGTSKALKAPQSVLGNRAAVDGHNLSRSMKRQSVLDARFRLVLNTESEELASIQHLCHEPLFDGADLHI